MGIKKIVLGALKKSSNQEIFVEDVHEMIAPRWDLWKISFEDLRSTETLVFLAKVFLATCVVAFGPALVLEYVPAKKVDVTDATDAGSKAGRTQRLLLAFAGGGLMAEAALHLLPHLFMPHGDSHHGDSHHDHDGLGDACELIALGFLAAFAINRFTGGGKQKKAGSGDLGYTALTTREEKGGAQEGSAAAGKEVESPAAAAATSGALKTAGDEGGGGGEGMKAVVAVAAPAADRIMENNSASPDSDDASDAVPAADVAVSPATESIAGVEEAVDATSTMRDGVDGEGLVGDVAPSSSAKSTVELPDKLEADAADAAAVTPSSESAVHQPELTLYGNPKTPATAVTMPMAEVAPAANEMDGDAAPPPEESSGATGPSDDRVASAGVGGDGDGDKGDANHNRQHDHGHHDEHHQDADAGANVTLAVDFLHNVIDGVGIGAAYALGGESMGHTTALLKLIHEIQHEVGDVATLVQCGMSKHHAIHIQHTTAGGVFLGVAISLGASAFPAGFLKTCLALSAGATFHLASGTVLGPVLAIPAEVGGSFQGFLEVAALAAGAAGVVAIGLAEKWAGLAH